MRKKNIIVILFLLLTNLSISENSGINVGGSNVSSNSDNNVTKEIDNIIIKTLNNDESKEEKIDKSQSKVTGINNSLENENIDNYLEDVSNKIILNDETEENANKNKNKKNSEIEVIGSNLNIENNKTSYQTIIDKNKAVVQAVDKEIQGDSDYNQSIIKYVVNKYGQVIKKENEKVKHPIASLTKVMNALVALDEIDKGNVSLNDKVCFDKETANIGGSWLNVSVGDCFTLEELLRAELIYSANNASYLIAKHVGKGDIDNFILLMNEKAAQLGMKNTEFHTPAGLPTSMTNKPMDISTAYDLSLMAMEAISDDRIVKWASEPFLLLINDKNEQVIYRNRNTLLDFDGVYGLKTGFHNLAGYNIIVVTSIGNMDIISIGLGYETSKQRHEDQKKELIESNNNTVNIYKAGDVMGISKLKWGKSREISGYLSEDVNAFKNDLSENQLEFIVKMENEIILTKSGIKKGDVIGKLQIINDGIVVSEVDILSSENVQGLSWFGRILRIITFGWL